MKKLLKDIRDNNILLEVVDGKLRIFASDPNSHPDLIDEIKAKKDELIRFLVKNDQTTFQDSFAINIPVSPVMNAYPLTSAQRSLWLISRLEKGNQAYNVSGVYELTGPLDTSALAFSFNNLIERHEILRTLFREDQQGNLQQYIVAGDQLNFSLAYVDCRSKSVEEIDTLIQTQLTMPFDLSRGPLVRASICRIEDNKCLFIYVMHHIISDGWSMTILIRELMLFYNSFVDGKTTALPSLRIQHKDYAVWQQDQLNNGGLKTHEEYWVKQFDDRMPLWQLPGQKIRPAVRSYNGEVVYFMIDPDMAKGIKSLSLQQGGTLFMALLAVVNALLYRYTDHEDIVIGSPVAGREHIDLEDQIGLYVNMLALRTRIKEENSFLDILQYVKTTTLEAYDHQAYPFDELINVLCLPMDAGRNSLFDIVVVLQNNETYNIEEQQHAGNLKIRRYNGAEQVASKFDLVFTFEESASGTIDGKIEFNTDIYEKDTITRMVAHFKGLLQAILHHPRLPVQELEYLEENEKQQLLFQFNDTTLDYPENRTIVDLFREQVSNDPDRTALIFQDLTLTYRELDNNSSQLASYLGKEYDILPDDRIGILLDRSEKMIITILAILKAGGAYVPIDPDYPLRRKEFIAQDTGIRLLITQTDYLYDLENYRGAVFAIDIQSYSMDVSGENKDAAISPRNMAYVMYTSGSTGNPKGVMVEHRSVVRLVKPANYARLTGKETLLATGSVSFDASTFEYWSMLLNGGKLVMCPKDVLLDQQKLRDEIQKNKVDTIWFTSGWLNQLVDKDPEIFESIKTLLAGGDKLSPAHINVLKTRYPDLRIINGYGPTENTTFSLTFPVTTAMENIPVGKPIENSTAYILDRRLRLLPVGIAGEIVVGGHGLSRGYLNSPELTGEKFVHNPFRKGEFLYRTGDLGKWLPDGNIEFIGRLDDQVKIRGYRVELGEIENTLQDHPDIAAAVVIAIPGSGGEKELAAYVVSLSPINVADLRLYLKGSLPDYMVPAHFVRLESLPLTANGKVDKRKLPDPEGLLMSTGVTFIAARNDIEKQLLAIWQEILDRQDFGVKDDFFALGGHSLKITRLASQIYKEFGIKLDFSELFTTTILEEQASLIGEVKKTGFLEITPVTPQEHYPLSSSQRRLWVLSQFEDGNVAYNMPGVFKFEGNLDTAALEYAFNALITRHEILRTVFKEDQQEGTRQFVLAPELIQFRIPVRDLRSDVTPEEKLNNLIRSSCLQPFHLSTGPLIRAELFQTKDREWIFAFVMHHIISDGWSLAVLMNELTLLYNIRMGEKWSPLSPLRIQYKDYAGWQQQQLEGRGLEEHKTYWLRQLEGDLPALEMPADRPRPAVRTYKGGVINRWLSPELVKGIKDYSREQGATLFMGLLAAINTLFYRYTGQQDFIIGSPIAGREHSDLDGQIGFYVNTLPLRTRLSGQDSYREVLENTRKMTLDAYRYQSYPFDELVDALDLPRDMSRNPIFDVMVVLQNTDTFGTKQKRLKDVVVSGYEGLSEENSKFDLNFDFAEKEEGVSVRIEYSSDLFNKSTVERLAAHLEQWLQAVTQYPETPVSRLDYFTPSEKTQLLVEFNDTQVGYPEELIIDRWERQVQEDPDKIALICDQVQLTRRQLNEIANQLGNYLRENYGIGPDDLVGIKLVRNEWLIITILGVLKAGGAYVPIDPAYPQERIDYMVKDSQCKVLIDEKEMAGFRSKNQQYGKDNLAGVNKPGDLVYVIYTSGSTGHPKGAMVKLQSFANLVRWYGKLLELQEEDRVLLIAPVSFDLAQKNIFSPLLYGAQLCLPPVSQMDYTVVAETIAFQKITIISAAPSAFYPLLDETINDGFNKLSTLKKIILGGEPMRKKDFLPWIRTGRCQADVFNSYGPTECTDIVSSYKIPDKAWETPDAIPIGKPVDNSYLYILDNNFALVPVGVTGEIFIAGICVGRGYLRQPELTAEKFVVNPFVGGGRMYRTGDLGKRLADGNIEYTGRKDDQVKIRGYRIELGEVETALQQLPDIRSAVVVAKSGPGGDKELVAYVTGKENILPPDLRSQLSRILPAHMIPAHFIRLDSIPLTPSGKIDRKRLPDTIPADPTTDTIYLAPRNPIEQRLVSIWQDVLGKEKIGVKDDFFALGGHSLKATRLASQIYKEFEVKPDFSELFTRTTPEEQAKLIGKLRTTAFSRIMPVIPRDHYPLSSSQRRLWLLSQFREGNIAYNMPGVYQLTGQLDKEALEHAFNALITRHEILRTFFKVDGQGEIHQYINPPEGSGFRIIGRDLRSETISKDKLAGLIDAVSLEPFDLMSGPLLRAELFQINDREWIFVYVMHHIISDGWSMGILTKELFHLYLDRIKGRRNSLPALPIQYKDYAVFQQVQMESGILQEQKDYWMRQLEGPLPILDLPGDRQRPAVKTYKGGSFYHQLSPELYEGIKSYSRQQGATLFMGLLAVVNTLLYRYTGQQDMIIGSPIAGREHIDLEGQIGFYVNTLALRIRCKGEDNFKQLLENIRQLTLEAYRNQAYPFDELVASLDLRRDTSRNALFDVMMVLQDSVSRQNQLQQDLGGLKVSLDEKIERMNSKFDLLFDFVDNGKELQLYLEYNSDIFNKDTIERLANHLQQVLNTVLLQPLLPIGELKYLTSDEQQQLLTGFNDTAVAYPKDRTVISLLEHQVKKTPDHTALVFREKKITYRQLNDLSNRLARQLQANTGIKKGECAAVLLDRSEWSAIAMISIMKLGCIYVPIDKSLPAFRISFILRQSGSGVLITDPSGRQDLVDTPKNLIIFEPGLLPENKDASDPGTQIDGADSSYIIYTSGSTGNPKGVEQTHLTLYNLISWDIHGAKMNQATKHLQFSSFGFDSAIHDIYYALATGGEVHIINEALRKDWWMLKEYILEKKIATLSMPYAALKSLFSEIPPGQFEGHSLEEIISTGEQLYITGGLRLFLKNHPSVKIYNLYGQSETHVVTASSYIAVKGELPEKADIGRPIHNTTIYMLDKKMQPVPIGVPGEIFIGGWNLAKGYNGNPGVAAEKFIDDPFRQGQRIYRSGDIGKWMPDGRIQYIMRKDDQVRINGYRVELAEVECALRRFDKIEEAIVLAKGTGAMEKSLTAYLVSKVQLPIIEIRNHLKLRLPAYMIPAYFIQLKKMPLTANGKVDVRSLPDPNGPGINTGVEYLAPRNEMESMLADMWSELLKIDRRKIGIKDNFFDLGGHSLKAISLISRINKDLEVRMAFDDLFADPTIEGMAVGLKALLWTKKTENSQLQDADIENFVF